MEVRKKDDVVFLKKLGERISTLRKQKGMLQVELASLLDIEKSNMSRIEAGNTNPTILLLKKICVVLEVNVENLLKDLDYESL
ncbi:MULTISPECIES: helix-turn-helix transcriptional regulator [unclassified Mucilaginibacter]|uniref:helix-turn-helix domain-containing protein n=1 Tax=unclassified Mucilaginibacter TaxID=2617802 RepID=UPI00339428B0